MSIDLGRRLLLHGALKAGELRHALWDSYCHGKPFPRALADISATARALLETPANGIRPVAPLLDLMATLPAGLAWQMMAVPFRRDPITHAVDVAVVDPTDNHVAAELSYHLGTPVRLFATPLSEIEQAMLLAGEPRTVLPSAQARGQQLLATAQPAPVHGEERRPSVRPPPTFEPPLEEDVVPLVRRSQRRAHAALLTHLSHTAPSSSPPPRGADNGPKARASLAPLSTTPFEAAPESARPSHSEALISAPNQMIVDFRAASRQQQSELAPQAQARATLTGRSPPYPSLTPVLEAIDEAVDRDSLVEAVLRGLSTTAECAALFAPRRGRWAGIGAQGELDAEKVRSSLLRPGGSIAEAVARGERLGVLDSWIDRELVEALGLERFAPTHVLMRCAAIGDRPALMLVSFGIADVLEGSRRARVLATAAATALSRLLAERRA